MVRYKNEISLQHTPPTAVLGIAVDVPYTNNIYHIPLCSSMSSTLAPESTR